MREVKNGGDPGIQRLKGTQPVPQTNISRTVGPRQTKSHLGQVLFSIRVVAEPPQQCLPRMLMGIDQPRSDDLANRVDHLRTTGRDSFANRQYLVVLDQHITTINIPKIRIHRDNVPTPNESSAHKNRAPIYQASTALD